MLKKLLCCCFVVLVLVQKSYSRNVFLHINQEKDRKYFFLDKEEEKTLDNIIKQVKSRSWLEAFKLEKKIKNVGFSKAINTYITVKKFESTANFSVQEIKGLIEFNTENHFLYSFNDFNVIIENAYLDDVVKYSDVHKYFSSFASKNIIVNIKLFKDLGESIKETEKNEAEKGKKLKELNKKISNFWTFKELNDDDGRVFYQNFSDDIPDSATILKIKLLIFKRKNFAPTINYLKDELYKRLFDVIIKISTSTDDIDKILKDVPKELSGDEVLQFTKLLYFRKTKNSDDAVKILLNLKESEIFSNHWWVYRHIYARNLLAEKKYKQAYIISSGFVGRKGAEYSESEWLSGWIAFNYLKQNTVALKHFQNLYSYVAFPSSISDSAYWIAKIYESNNMKRDALKWYNISSKYPTTFYGQLSHYAKYNILVDSGEEYQEIIFPTPQEATAEEMENLNNNEVVKLGILYYKYLNERDNGFEILKYAVQKGLKSRGEISELIEILETFNDENIIIPLAKLASHRMVFFLKHLFPMLRSVKKSEAESGLIHAIIKQESGFVIKAESVAGALGFMQIMPATAKQLCKDLRITYSQYKLQHDPQYNIVLGKHYIRTLLRRYKESKVLAIAAYNAGPSNCNRWLQDYGDPRDENTISSVVNWVESIPFKETRNYVKRVLENLIVYEYIMANM
ncbi:MAG: lytic transglycosylase domain-containing protein [Rickettsiales bacterium]|jgi:soluble lytic murein transglycosylase|nr:lytic transglycosylase domain-containing protein [Rickettsiales bacterium]